jgi:drug/metabolite transporter (DMT)-like permease
MASTYEMFLASLALLVNTLLVLVMYFVMNITLAPVFAWAGTYFAASPPVIPMTDISYLPAAIFGILLATEVVFIIAFIAVIFRRETIGGYEGGL